MGVQSRVSGRRPKALLAPRPLHPQVEELGLSAAIYTQLSDVEHEWNGLLSYDREWKCQALLQSQLSPAILATRAALSGDAAGKL